MSRRAKFYIYGVIAAGAVVLCAALRGWPVSTPPVTLTVFIALAMLSSLLKLKLPGMDSTYSLSFLFLLFGIGHFTLAETIITGCAASLVQSVCRRKNRPAAIQALFNMANLTLSVGVCFLMGRYALPSGLDRHGPAEMAMDVFVYFVVNTVLVSGVLSLLQGKRLAYVWRQWYDWSFPYYLVGALLVGLIPVGGRLVATEAWLILLPLSYLIHFFLGLLRHGFPTKTGGASESRKSRTLPTAARLYLAGVLAAGMLLFVGAMLQWQSQSLLRFASYLVLSPAVATLKVRLPGMQSSVSMGFVLVLVAITELSFAEAVVISLVVGIVQCLWRPKHQPNTLQVFFNAACLSLSTAITCGVGQELKSLWQGQSLELLVGWLVVATTVRYISNTVMVAAMLCLKQRQPLNGIWQDCYFWTWPYYTVGATASGLMIAISRTAGWQASLWVLPLMALSYVSFQIHLFRAEATQRDSAVWGS